MAAWRDHDGEPPHSHTGARMCGRARTRRSEDERYNDGHGVPYSV